MHSCPYCDSEDIGVINILNTIYSIGCKSCGMTGPQGENEEDARAKWEGLCHTMCHHCISRPWGKAMIKRVKKLADEMLEETNNGI